MQDPNFTQTLFSQFPARKLPVQKQAFLRYAAAQYNTAHPAMPMAGRGYTNLLFGDPSAAKVVLAADYTTPYRRYFPYVHFPASPLLCALQFALPLGLLLAMALCITVLLHWPLPAGVLLFLPAALAACGAFFNVANHTPGSSLICLHRLAADQGGRVCIALLDGRRGRRALRRALPPDTLLLQIGYVSRGALPVLVGNSPGLAAFPEAADLCCRKLPGKKPWLTLHLCERRPAGLSAGPVGTPQDTLLSPHSQTLAENLIRTLLTQL